MVVAGVLDPGLLELTKHGRDHVARYVMRTTIAEDAAILSKMSATRTRNRQVLTKFDWIVAKYRKVLRSTGAK